MVPTRHLHMVRSLPTGDAPVYVRIEARGRVFELGLRKADTDSEPQPDGPQLDHQPPAVVYTGFREPTIVMSENMLISEGA